MKNNKLAICHYKLSFNRISLHQIIEEELKKILFLYYSEISLQTPLSRCKNSSSIVYRSVISFSIAKQTGLSPQQIAIKIVTLLTQLPVAASADLDFTISVLPSGIIDFSLDNIAKWLQLLPHQFTAVFVSLALNPSTPLSKAGLRGDWKGGWGGEEIFFLEFTSMRCLSLLRLAEQKNLIKLKNLNYHQPEWFWLEPESIPYFNLFHPQEEKLITEFIVITDAMASENIKDWLQLVRNLSTSFWQFERYCRIFGELNPENSGLSHARLSLVAFTHFLLHLILQNYLKVNPRLSL